MAFALGITFGIGTAWLMWTTGVMLGTLGAVFIEAGQFRSYCTGILPHGVLEIPSCLIGGAAGFMLAEALFGARPWSRLDELARRGLAAIWMVGGSLPLLAMAGFLEAVVARARIASSTAASSWPSREWSACCSWPISFCRRGRGGAMIFHEVITTERVPFRYRVAGLGSRFLRLAGGCSPRSAPDPHGLHRGHGAGDRPRRAGGHARPALELRGAMGLLFALRVALAWADSRQTAARDPGDSVGRNEHHVSPVGRTECAPSRRWLAPAGARPGPVSLWLGPPDCPLYARTTPTRRSGGRNARRPRRTAGTADSGAGRARNRGRAPPRQSVLRQRLSQLNREQKQTIVDLCLRRNQLAAAERARLFRTTAGFFKERFDLVPAEFQSDEKFVLELAAALQNRELKSTTGPRNIAPVVAASASGVQDRSGSGPRIR